MTASDNFSHAAAAEPSGAGGGLLDVGVSVQEDGVTLLLTGELDIASAPALRTAVAGIDRAVGRIVIDLKGLEFMDSSGLACLLASDREVRRDGRELYLRGLQGQARMLLDLTGLAGRFSFEQ